MNDSQTVFPEFFVVGTQKAGTTSLHAWLQQQPDVCLPKIKETHFFSNCDIFHRGIDWYRTRFPTPAPDAVIGEVCPDYIFSDRTPARIRKWNAKPRVVYVFRHPLERAFSHYRMSRRAGNEPLDFPSALLQEPQRLSTGGRFAYANYSYLARGRYAEQIELWQRELPEAESLFVKFDDLIDAGKTGRRTYEQICDFVGVTSSPAIADRSLRLNVASAPRSSLIADLIHKPSSVKKLVGRCIPSRDLRHRMMLALEQWNLRPIRQQEEIRVPPRFVEEARQQIRLLALTTGLNLDDWLARTFLPAPVRSAA